ncbi:hypothetical protein BDW67DRAFT_54973 [Aspergillus spinulosporus]
MRLCGSWIRGAFYSSLRRGGTRESGQMKMAETPSDYFWQTTICTVPRIESAMLQGYFLYVLFSRQSQLDSPVPEPYGYSTTVASIII